MIPVSKSPKAIRQTTSQISRKPAPMGTVLIKTSAKTESSPVMVKKHKSASACISDTFTPRSESGLRCPVNGDFVWSSVFIKIK